MRLERKVKKIYRKLFLNEDTSTSSIGISTMVDKENGDESNTMSSLEEHVPGSDVSEGNQDFVNLEVNRGKRKFMCRYLIIRSFSKVQFIDITVINSCSVTVIFLTFII